MTPQERRRLALLSLGLLVPIGLWQVLEPRILGGTDVGGAGRRDRAAATAVDREVVELHMADLERSSREVHSVRNLFAYGQPPAPPPPPPAPPPVFVPPPPPAPPPPPVKPQPPVPAFKLIGIFGPDGRRIAVLRQGKDLLNVREGEVVQNKFIVDRIGLESVDVRFVDFPDEPARRLPMGG